MTDFGQALEALARRRRHARVRGGRAPRGDPVAGARDARSGVSHEHHEHARGVRRGRSPGAPARRVGIERDDARPAVRTPARLRAGRRGPHVPGDELRAVEGARRGDGPPVQPLERDAVHRAAVLEHHGSRRLRALSRPTGTTRTCASGTCGATSTRATSRRAFGSRSRPTSMAPTTSSSPLPTR